MMGDFTLLYGNDDKMEQSTNDAVIAYDFDCLGYWDPVTNIPELVDGTGTNLKYYIVSQDGSIDLGSGTIEFFKNDRIKYDDSLMEWARTT